MPLVEPVAEGDELQAGLLGLLGLLAEPVIDCCPVARSKALLSGPAVLSAGLGAAALVADGPCEIPSWRAMARLETPLQVRVLMVIRISMSTSTLLLPTLGARE